jgi:hypothetical protein
MTRTQLAEQLRQKIRERGEIPPEMLTGLDDDFIVDGYLNTACEDCGKKLAEGLDVEQVLAESQSLDDFLTYAQMRRSTPTLLLTFTGRKRLTPKERKKARRNDHRRDHPNSTARR